MAIRKILLTNDGYYHIFNKSIAGYTIFNTSSNFDRIISLINYYQFSDIPNKFSIFNKLNQLEKSEIINQLNNNNNKVVDIVAYCIMPTHFHLILRQNVNIGISEYVAKITNSYSHYFNLLHHRKGPLWQSRFKNVMIGSDEQLFHLSRYLHLNPVTSKIVDKPQDWKYSSYFEYLNGVELICRYKNVIGIDKKTYQKFVDNQTNYQRRLHEIKKIILE